MELSQAFSGFVDSGNAKMEMGIVLGFMKQYISSNCRAWTRRLLAKFDKIWKKLRWENIWGYRKKETHTEQGRLPE